MLSPSRTTVQASKVELNLQTNLANYPTQPIVVRRRFQDFAFLRDHLVKAFPASVVPPIPDKHRMGMYGSPIMRLGLALAM